jgi:hypothetical protein
LYSIPKNKAYIFFTNINAALYSTYLSSGAPGFLLNGSASGTAHVAWNGRQLFLALIAFQTLRSIGCMQGEKSCFPVYSAGTKITCHLVSSHIKKHACTGRKMEKGTCVHSRIVVVVCLVFWDKI